MRTPLIEAALHRESDPSTAAHRSAGAANLSAQASCSIARSTTAGSERSSWLANCSAAQVCATAASTTSGVSSG